MRDFATRWEWNPFHADSFIWLRFSLSLSLSIDIDSSPPRRKNGMKRVVAHEPRIVSRLVAGQTSRFDGWKRASNGNCYPFPDNEYLKYRARLMYSLLLRIGHFPSPPLRLSDIPWNRLIWWWSSTELVSFRFVSFPNPYDFSEPVRKYSIRKPGEEKKGG